MPLTGLPSPVEFLLKGLLCAGELISWDSHGGENEVIVTLKFSASGDYINNAAVAGATTDNPGKIQASQNRRNAKGKPEDPFKGPRPVEHKGKTGDSFQAPRPLGRPPKPSPNDSFGDQPRPLDAKRPYGKFQQESHKQYGSEQSRYLGPGLEQDQGQGRSSQQQQLKAQQYRGNNTSPLSTQQHIQRQQQQHQQQQQQQFQQQQLQQQRQQQAMSMSMPMMQMPLHMMQQRGPRMPQMPGFNKQQYQGNVYAFTCYNKNRPGQVKANQVHDKRDQRDYRDYRERDNKSGMGNNHMGVGCSGKARPHSSPNHVKNNKHQQPMKQKPQKQQGQHNKFNQKQSGQDQMPQQGHQNKHIQKQQAPDLPQAKEQPKDPQSKHLHKQLTKQNKKKQQRQQKQQESYLLKHSTDDGEGSNSAEETNNGASADWSEQMNAKSPLDIQESNSSDTDNVQPDNSGSPQRRSPNTGRDSESPAPQMQDAEMTSSSTGFVEEGRSMEVVHFDMEAKGFRLVEDYKSMTMSNYKDPNLIEQTYEGAISVPCLVKELSADNQCAHVIEPDENYFKCGECGNAYCSGCAKRGLANPHTAVPGSVSRCFSGHSIQENMD